MRVLLLTGDRKTARLYANISEQTSILRLFVVKNTAQALERLYRDPFDALLSDDLSVLQPDIRGCGVQWPAHTFLLVDKPIDTIRLPGELTFCFLKDSEPKTVLLQIASFPKGSKPIHGTETAISSFLQQVGVPVSLSGFSYLAIALRLFLSRNNPIDLQTVGDIYMILSMATGISAYMAEHAIRRAIDAAWMRADTSELEKLFGYTVRPDRGAPSNAAFLFRAADHIRLIRGGIMNDIGRNV